MTAVNSVVRAALQAIYDEEGRLTPAAVVERARPQDSPLHGQFEWDDAAAAHRHRLDRARHLIRSVKIRYQAPTGELRETRQWVNMRTAATPSTYLSVTDVAQDDLASRVVLAEAERKFRELMRAYKDLAGFMEMARRVMDEPPAA